MICAESWLFPREIQDGSFTFPHSKWLLDNFQENRKPLYSKTVIVSKTIDEQGIIGHITVKCKHCDRSFKGQPCLNSHVQFKHPASAAQNSNSISSAPRNTLTIFVNINNHLGETNMQRMAESQQLEDVPHKSAGVAQGQTQRRSNNRRGSNEQKSYTVDFIKKTLIFWIHWNHQLISTTQLQSNKESKDRWWLSWKKTEANFLQNWLWTRQRRTQVVQGQWDKGVSLGTDPNALINILWLPIFYSPSLNYGHQQEAKCPNLGSKKNIKSKIEASYGAEEAAKFKESSNWLQRFKERHNILLRRRTTKEKVGADDGRDTIQKFHRDWSLENTREKKQALYSWPKVWKMDT